MWWLLKEQFVTGTYIDTFKADNGLDNTKEITDAMLDQVVWKDFIRMARDDPRPE